MNSTTLNKEAVENAFEIAQTALVEDLQYIKEIIDNILEKRDESNKHWVDEYLVKLTNILKDCEEIGKGIKFEKENWEKGI